MFSNPSSALRTDQIWALNLQTTRGGWAFDVISFFIGLVFAFTLVGLAYRYRAQIAAVRNQAKEQWSRLHHRLTASMATRYNEAVVETGQSRHLLGGLAPFDKIYVETKLHAPLASVEDDAGLRSPSPLQAIHASKQLCVSGPPGSGRTMLLNQLLLYQANQAQVVGDGEPVPVYVYLPALAAALTEMEEADTSDDNKEAPDQLLVKTALGSMSRLVATGVARWLRRQVAAGNALILLDGWDELALAERPIVTSWIQELATAHPGNRHVVTAGERGYAPLIEAGFALLRPAPWTHRQLNELATRWIAVWPHNEEDQRESVPAVSYTFAPPTPLEATVELAIQLNGQLPADTPAGKMAQIVGLLLPSPEIDDDGQTSWPLETAHRALGLLALSVFEQGRPVLERDEVQSTVTEELPPPQSAAAVEIADNASEFELDAEERERRTLQVVDCCRALTAIGAPIRAWDSQHFSFAHPLVAAFLAARHLAIADISVLAHADDPTWIDVLRFYVGLAPAERLIERLLDGPDDLFLNRLWTAATLLAAASPDHAPWRVRVVKRLAQLFLNRRLPMLLRDWSLAALAESREAGVGPLFRQTATNSDPHLRARAVLGLGALGREQDLALMEVALEDESPDVRLAAVNALSVLARTGNEKALDLIIASTIETADEVQRAAVEALAESGTEGHAVLVDAAKDHDIIVRRAAVYGLTAVGEPWAREILEHMQREDDQWLVRNAAAEALETLDLAERRDAPFEIAIPRAETETWLIQWAAERGEGTGVGDAALTTLIRASTEGDLSIREQAVETLRRLAIPETIDALCQNLRDPEPSIRDAALLALDEISRRHNITVTVR